MKPHNTTIAWIIYTSKSLLKSCEKPHSMPETLGLPSIQLGVGHCLAATSNDIHVFGVSVGRVAMGCHAKILTACLEGGVRVPISCSCRADLEVVGVVDKVEIWTPKTHCRSFHWHSRGPGQYSARGVVSYPGSCNMSDIAHGFTVTLHDTFQEFEVPAAVMSNNDHLQLSHKFEENMLKLQHWVPISWLDTTSCL